MPTKTKEKMSRLQAIGILIERMRELDDKDPGREALDMAIEALRIKPEVLVIVEGGLIQEIASNIPLVPTVADLDVFDCGDLDHALEFEPSEWEPTDPADFPKVEAELEKRIAEEKEKLKDLAKRKITPFIVPDDDKDHQGSVYDKDKDKEKEESLP